MPSWAFSFLLQKVSRRRPRTRGQCRECIPELFASGDTAFPEARRVAARIHPSSKGNLTKRNTSEHVCELVCRSAGVGNSSDRK
jgi:hypothetical protein